MVFTLEHARELRDNILAEKKAERKARVDEIVARSISVNDAETRMREVIMSNPEQTYFGIYVLDTVTNDWNDPHRDKILEEVQEELVKKYKCALPDVEVVEMDCGNNRMSFRITMTL